MFFYVISGVFALELCARADADVGFLVHARTETRAMICRGVYFLTPLLTANRGVHPTFPLTFASLDPYTASF